MNNIPQKALTLFIVVVIVYSLLKENISTVLPLDTMFDSTQKTEQEIKDKEKDVSDKAKDFEKSMEGNFIERSISKIVSNVIKTEEGKELFTKMIRPTNSFAENNGITIKFDDKKILNSLFKMTEITQGHGMSACCGDKVKINYKLYKSEGTENQDLELILGDSELKNNFITSLFVGMKKNSKISALVPNNSKNLSMNDLQVDHTKYTQIEASLIEILHSDINPSEIKIFNDGFSYFLPVLCGDKIKFNLVIEDLTGKILFTTEKEKAKIEMNLGDKQFPAIFSYAIFNQTISVNRTIIAPAKYLRNFEKKFNLSNLNNNQYILMKITDLENLNFNLENIKNDNNTQAK